MQSECISKYVSKNGLTHVNVNIVDLLRTDCLHIMVQWSHYSHYNLWSRYDLHVVGQRGILCEVGNL